MAYLLKKTPAEILDMDWGWFLCMFKWIRIAEMEKTEEGRDALEQAWILTQTEPDMEALEKNFGVKKVIKEEKKD